MNLFGLKPDVSLRKDAMRKQNNKTNSKIKPEGRGILPKLQ